MDDPKPSPPDDEAPEIADAAALFRDDPAPRPSAAPSGPSDPAAVDAYEVEGVPDAPGEVAPPVPVARPEALRPKATAAASTARPARAPEEAVEQVWSRGAEWGGTLLLLTSAGLGVGVVVYALLAVEQYGLAFLALLAGGAALVVLSYPILVTLERPVRVTPEQAVRDYFAALSHHVPHYRRMWLLLSSAGRVSGSFASFEGFCSYWKGRLARLREGRASGLTPLKFQVDDFKSEKSAGKSEIDARFTVKVFVRGRLAEGPVGTFPVETSLVKGPDRMWYLDKGTLPD